ncbi:MAG TPA: MBL fold metallo-hydrolase [Pseudoneobacillus sp.]|nr:MBL fold metallo-hydrolase [Pseudoneobacillus sp.]
MKITKLTWASILIESEGISILVDPLGAPITGQEKPFAAKLGEALEPIFTVKKLNRPYCILVTHTHPDHFDYQSILVAFGPDISIYVPNEATDFVEKLGFHRVIGAEPNDEFFINHIKIAASYSVDGFGTPQVSWIINAGKQTVIHCGDTQWHGYWWRISQKYGPIHAAFLPVNGPILNVFGLKTQSSLPACLTPEEAVEAAKILEADYLIPIHYGIFNNPPHYCETHNIEERLMIRGEEVNVKVKILKTNEMFTIG